ncbi:MAG: SufD family Fe-S cluster assembly protein [Clostridia bacterium]|nr:SufD family Fe-S cluster assembly protein [Clostridia bacterium]
MTAFTLEQAGLNFKRIPLPEEAMIHPTKHIIPKVKLGDLNALVHDVLVHPLKKHFDRSLGIGYDTYIKTHKNSGYQLWLKKESSKQFCLHFDQTEIIENNTIIIEPYVTKTVILIYDHEMIHHGMTKIVVKEGASLKLVKLQNTSRNSIFVDENLIEVEENGKIEIIDFQIGGKRNIVNYEVNLLGYQAKAEMQSAYLGSNEDGIDISMTVNHFGKKSESRILGKGVLSGHAKKVFRGTLEFHDGSAQSVGKEEEVVLLLSDDVNADSIPALMCSEDDVIGEHGASIGQVDEEQLFYLMSRGLSENQSKLLIIESAFSEIVQAVEVDTVKETLHKWIEEGIDYVV